ncbi:uncharacterized protein LAESUDRAFT_718923 [Laetiporus sulphureus 93-53]|uniref:Uncharacterized protein n=1 Tax=Laetiporus sulphureus 93-53 TaxID=1314785 RepID=A0A165I645_9APHY|nr:uncharacterized protein LAESUDRAFT_718923 [Laetiporus sulphureus 93-53]KZT12642.1 hypothetical protein LAESUDRAFT_718923 [Laetiporus sulphureus 93-53]
MASMLCRMQELVPASFSARSPSLKRDQEHACSLSMGTYSHYRRCQCDMHTMIEASGHSRTSHMRPVQQPSSLKAVCERSLASVTKLPSCNRNFGSLIQVRNHTASSDDQPPARLRNISISLPQTCLPYLSEHHACADDDGNEPSFLSQVQEAFSAQKRILFHGLHLLKH